MLGWKRLKDLLITGTLRIYAGGLNIVAPSGVTLTAVSNGLTAFATGGQTSATLLGSLVNRFTTVATAADSAKLPVSAASLAILVINDGANPMQVFGNGSDTINDIASGTGVSQMPGSAVLYTCPVAGKWKAQGIGVGYASGLQTMSFVNAITAFATGGQASATALTGMLNRITVCATAGDSVKLPTSAAGMVVVVTSAVTSGKGNDVFPATGDAINNLAANLAIRQPPGTTLTFVCDVAGTWNVTIPQPDAKFTTRALSSATAAAGELTGAKFVTMNNSGATPGTFTTRTAAQMIADGFYQVGDSYNLRIVNGQGTGVLTLAAGDGNVTLTGTMTMATNSFRDFVVTITAAGTLTIQSTATGTFS